LTDDRLRGAGFARSGAISSTDLGRGITNAARLPMNSYA
jgi:hypothetical protein